MIKRSKIIFILVLLSGFPFFNGCQQLTGSDDTFALDSVNSQSGGFFATADDGQLSEEQKTRYRRDAEILAVRYINEKDSAQTEIPESLIRTLYNGLIHIVNADTPEARKASQLKYSIHARNPGSAREVLVYADSTAPWVDPWRNEVTETGNPEVDDLIDRFNLTLVDFNELTHTLRSVTVKLRSDRAINVFAVSRLFRKLNDIENAHPVYTTDGSDISVLFFDDFLRYTFEYGFGDCPAGCINRHIWKFNVHQDGSVDFVGETGDPLPAATGSVIVEALNLDNIECAVPSFLAGMKST